MHDLSDPAIHRRVRMLTAGGADVQLAGFRRTAAVPHEISGCEFVDLGQTRDGAFLARIGSVAAAGLNLGRLDQLVRGSQVVLARNLEMLYVAAKARRRYAPSAPLIYECLDIHRLLLGRALPNRLLRAMEKRLMRDVDHILTSSPRFVSEYFAPRGFDRPITILENKVLLVDREMDRQMSRPSGPPWKIGWFGMIRCRRSLEILSAAAQAMNGLLEVRIAGRPSPKEFPDFEAQVAACPHLSFLGSYRFEDLPKLYGDVHFSWAIDFFEEGLNSSWLLPNRIYESSFFGAIPIALQGVETARWLQQRGIGAVLDGDPTASLSEFIRDLTDARYEELTAALRNVPSPDLAATRQSCGELLKSFETLGILARAGV
ncbi:glycosyltransferase [Bradyrhizobium sp. SZCCHNPS10062]|uniref:glycosyltransferase n=1 Tax=unclassified Bradyrhizobium TaxID=2631580 RepID=UPI0039648C40